MLGLYIDMTPHNWFTKIKTGVLLTGCLVVGILAAFTIQSFLLNGVGTHTVALAATNQEISNPKNPDSPTFSVNSTVVNIDTFIASEIPKPAPKKHIEVNLTEQKMTALEDDQVVKESPITSGRDGYPTVTGDFAIYLKQENTRLKSPFPELHYDFPVRYWMPFYSGYGIHDAYWRTEFGGQDYHWAGSHGCLNTPDDMVEFIWNWSNIGTIVHVVE